MLVFVVAAVFFFNMVRGSTISFSLCFEKEKNLLFIYLLKKPPKNVKRVLPFLAF